MPSSLPPPSKKRKISSKPLSKDGLEAVKNLETQLTTAVSKNESLNALADLLDIARSANDVQVASKAIYALYRVNVTLITAGKLGSSSANDEKAKLVRAWLLERLNDYVEFLGGLLKDGDKILRTSSLQILFSLQKHLSTSLTVASNQPQFHVSHFKKIIHALLACPPSTRATAKPGKGSEEDFEGRLASDVRDTFVETWLSVHDDIRWFFLRESGSLLLSVRESESQLVATNLLSLLERLTTFPTEPSELNTWWVEELGKEPPASKRSKSEEAEDEAEDEVPSETEGADADDWRKFFDEPSEKDLEKKTKKQAKKPSVRPYKMTIHQSLHSLSAHRAVFTQTWLSLLQRIAHAPMEIEARKSLSLRVLNVMHRGILPHLTRPVLVMDWVAGCVDYGGVVGLLALNALFILMKEFNLDYPSFYTRLYAFLDRDILYLKHRARFFRLIELFLSSTHLPATLLASFVKRLSRLSLNAPPAAIVMLIPFTYNVLKRHPALMVMIHRTDEIDAENDVFDENEPNPNLTNALDSSLWELYSHKNHYHSSVSTLVKIFEEPFTKPGYALEDFLDHTYGTLFDTEVKQRIKKEPAVEDSLGKNIFPSIGGATAKEVALADPVAELWTFA